METRCALSVGAGSQWDVQGVQGAQATGRDPRRWFVSVSVRLKGLLCRVTWCTGVLCVSNALQAEGLSSS